jgi:hypothetical protein
LKGFQSPQVRGDQKVINHHSLMVVATEFDYHLMTMTKFGCHQMSLIISIVVDGSCPFFITIWETSNSDQIFSQSFAGDQFLKRFLGVYAFKNATLDSFWSTYV